jgi:AcrR family transcriptional regulator
VSGRPVDNGSRREARRQRILVAAEDLLVTHGVERTRLRDVADAAGVSIGTVQHYFDTRARLIGELFAWSSSRRLHAWLSSAPVDPDPWRRLVSLLHASLPEPLLWRSRLWIEFCAMARDDTLRVELATFYDAWRPPFREVIDDGIAAGVFRPRMPVADIVDQLIILVDGAQVAVSLGAPGITADQLRRVFVEAAAAALGIEPAQVGADPATLVGADPATLVGAEPGAG